MKKGSSTARWENRNATRKDEALTEEQLLHKQWAEDKATKESLSRMRTRLEFLLSEEVDTVKRSYYQEKLDMIAEAEARSGLTIIAKGPDGVVYRDKEGEDHPVGSRHTINHSSP